MRKSESETQPAGGATTRPVPARNSVAPSRWRMLWLLLGRGDLLPFLSGPLAAAGVLTLALAASPVAAVFVAGGYLFGCWRLLRELRAGRGLRVTERNQPALAALVAGTAGALGAPVPDRVWLTPGTNATALSVRFPRRRDEICLGVGAVAVLSDPELRATVAHELAHLDGASRDRAGPDRPDRLAGRLADRLLVERRAAADRWEHLSERRRAGPNGRRLARFLAETQALAHAEERRADAAATRVVDADVAARSLVREYAAGERFVGYVLRCVTPLVQAGMYPSELHSGWITWCATPAFWCEEFMSAATEGTGTLADEHPSLRARITAYGAPEVAIELPVPHPDSVLRPLDADAEEVLSRHFAVRSGVAPRFRWRRLSPVRWADVPLGLYDSCDTWLRRALTTVAADLLGRPATAVDVVDLLAAGRRGDLQPILVAHLTERAGDASTAAATAAIPDATLLAVMAFPALRARGYRLAGPIAQHLLVGPDGDRADLAALGTRALADPWVLTRLRRLLSAQAGRRADG